MQTKIKLSRKDIEEAIESYLANHRLNYKYNEMLECRFLGAADNDIFELSNLECDVEVKTKPI